MRTVPCSIYVAYVLLHAVCGRLHQFDIHQHGLIAHGDSISSKFIQPEYNCIKGYANLQVGCVGDSYIGALGVGSHLPHETHIE
jgi:hypothetical protein